MSLTKWLILISIIIGIFALLRFIYPVSANYEEDDWIEVSPSPSVSPSPEESASPEPSIEPCIQFDKEFPEPCPTETASPSATPTDAPRPGLSAPQGGTSGSDGHCTYDPNRSACGGKDPVIPSSPPSTGRGGS